ncbi:homoserine kinase [Hydrogenivirga caldilitoris]|uniref:Homoserine kinase n=1 Tax=Hydrogenivirga caldilitoris TaxID=246264 RepID=A0A497XMM5_9AQUI|nr:homoserine kinase [Hydrogenivirga caldilitoris]RLJ70167.1 homoserine kinase [Hydrogenivirga caldilitoris]
MKLLVPATTTNFGSGFDTFGLALNLYNTFEFRESDAFGVEVEGEGKELPRDENNLLIRVYKRACEVFGVPVKPFKLKQVNEVPTARGLGSSATAIVGGIEACVRLHSLEVNLEDKMKVAFEFEPHPDNLLPAFVGGFVVCVQNGGLVYNRLDFPDELSLVFAVPDFELSTEEARRVIKREVSLKDAVFNIQRASLLVSAILTGKYELLRTAVEDRLHQPYRAKLIKGFEKVLEAGYSAGAYAVFLSGAGPTVCAISSGEVKDRVGSAMIEAFEREGVRAKVLHLKGSGKGAHWL